LFFEVTVPNQPPSQEQQTRRADQQSKPSDRSAKPAPRENHISDIVSKNDLNEQVRGDESPGIKIGEVTAIAGRMGERNLTIQWIDVWIGNNKPCRFIVNTRAEHGLEVHVEQAAYQKMYTGTGSVSTLVIPVVPIGTKGKLMARDSTTGETSELPWVWVSLGGLGFFARLWAAIKRSLWNPTS
jgi:hypothetical protein